MVSQLGEENREYPLVVVATAHSAKMVSNDMHEAFLHHINVEVSVVKGRGSIILIVGRRRKGVGVMGEL